MAHTVSVVAVHAEMTTPPQVVQGEQAVEPGEDANVTPGLQVVHDSDAPPAGVHVSTDAVLAHVYANDAATPA